MLPTPAELHQHLAATYGDTAQHGWRVRMRQWFGYVSPELVYETLVNRLVEEGTRWLDVGGGKSVFPHNPQLATALSERCGLLVGLDPSNAIQENQSVHKRVQRPIEDYSTTERFDVATLRMVAEHIAKPSEAVATLAAVMNPGGTVVVYTPNKWSPASIAARLVPNRWHHRITSWLWRTKEEDVFPTLYRMNTHPALATVFSEAGFREVGFAYLDACCLGQRFRAASFAELVVWRALHSLRLHYPETNLLAVYERVEDDRAAGKDGHVRLAPS